MAKKISRKFRLAMYAAIVLVLGAGAGAIDNFRRGTGVSPTPEAFADGVLPTDASDGTGGPGDAGACPSDSDSDCCD